MSGAKRRLSCDELAGIVAGTNLRTVVLMGLHEDGPGIQFVTYGRCAADKSEAHNLKEWIKDEVFDGKPPPPVTHESFILDAARVKQERDDLLAALEYIVAWAPVDWSPAQARDMALAAIAKAKGAA